MKVKELKVKDIQYSGLNEISLVVEIEWFINSLWGGRMKDIESITIELKNLAEERKSEMSANVHDYIWNMIQTIEHDFKLGQYSKDK